MCFNLVFNVYCLTRFFFYFITVVLFERLPTLCYITTFMPHVSSCAASMFLSVFQSGGKNIVFYSFCLVFTFILHHTLDPWFVF